MGERSKALLLAAAALTPAAGARAQTAANLIAAQRLAPFTQLDSTAEGRALLARNLQTSIAINNGSTAAQRAQAVSDNNILSDQGVQFATALGPRLNNAYTAAIAASDPRLATTGKVGSIVQMFRTFYAVSSADSNFNKFYLANGTTNGRTPATGPGLPPGGIYDTYDVAYGVVPGTQDPYGDSRPFQVAPTRIDPFAASITSGLVANPSFPSGHTTFGQTEALLTAIMVPERFQQVVNRGSEYGYSRVVLGAHYVLDVIAGRILAYQDVAAMLNNDPRYTGGQDFAGLFATATADYRAVLAAGCGGTVAACAAAPGTGDTYGNLAQDKVDYTYRLTYGLPSVGRTDLAPVVPTGAEVLLSTRFPYLTAQQRRDVLASTELPSGVPLDDGSGWARLDLYAAGGGYGSLTGNVVVTQDASKGGFNAYDAWSNDIGGTGSLTKAGTGTLALSGANSFSGGVTVTGGTLLLLSSGALPAAGGVVNAATLSLAEGTAGGVATTATYAGRSGSVLALDVDLSKGLADRLVVTGAVTGGSTIALTNVAASTGTALAAGAIPLVTAGSGLSAGAFTLAGGTIDRGLVRYALGATATRLSLVPLAGTEAERLPALVSGAQNLWFDGASAWDDHAADLRDAAADAGRRPAVWVRGFGRWITRDQAGVASGSGATLRDDTGYRDQTHGVLAGVDFTAPDILGEGSRLTAGVMGGYIHGRQNFNDTATLATEEGGTVGAGLSLQGAGGLFADVRGKADLARLHLSVPALASFGAQYARPRANTYGVQADLGWHVATGAQSFVEPIATVAYADADLDDLSIGGGQVAFDRKGQLRGRAGFRAGFVRPVTGGAMALGLDGSVWHRFSDRPDAAIAVDGGSLLVGDTQVKTFGDTGATLSFTGIHGFTLFARGGYQFARAYRSEAVTAGVRLAL